MEAAGLTDLLKQEGDFTLFAPSDEALAGLTEREISILKSKSPDVRSRGFQRLFCRTWDVSGVSGQKGHIQDRGTTGPGYLTRTHHFYFLWSGDPNALRTILLYHFSKGIFIGGGLESGVTNLLKSLQGSYLKVLFVSV